MGNTIKKYKNHTGKIIITGCTKELTDEVSIICMNMNEERSRTLRRAIKDWADAQPDNMKKLPVGWNPKE